MIKNASFGNILHSEQIAVIFIAPLENEVGAEFKSKTDLSFFIEEIHSKNIPIVSCVTSSIGTQRDVFEQNGIQIPSLKNFKILKANPCLDSTFTETISGLNRQTLLLLSSTIEGYLTMVALSFLELGYDVCVLPDIAKSPLRASDRYAFDRLLQAGVVPLM